MSSPAASGLSYPAEQVRRYDHDRFLTAIFAPADIREHLFALYAFNLEIAKTSEVVTEPLIGRIRLQWWRDTLDRLYAGERVAHGVAGPLGAAIATGRLDRAEFDRLIDAREFDLDRTAPADFAALHDYAEATAAPLLALALSLSSGPHETTGAVREIARLAGAGWALTGLLRAAPFHARQRRVYLPADRLAAAGVKIARLWELKPEPGLTEVTRGVGEHARRRLLDARQAVRALPRTARAPALLTELGLLYLHDLERAGWNPFTLEAQPGRRFAAATLAWRRFVQRY